MREPKLQALLQSSWGGRAREGTEEPQHSQGSHSGRAIRALSRTARLELELELKEEQPSFPATTFQVSGDCWRGREERGAGFVCLARALRCKTNNCKCS